MCALVDGTAGCRDQSDLSLQGEVGTKAVRLFCGNVCVCGGGGGREKPSLATVVRDKNPPSLSLSASLAASYPSSSSRPINNR